MKKNRFFTGVMCTLAVVALSACGQEAQEQLQYVSLSQAGCTFFGTDNEPLAVTVETSPAQWAAEASASWVKAEPGEDGTTLVLSVEDNDGDAERKAAVTVTAGQASQTITVYQLAPDLSINRFRKERMFQNGGVVSPSGKYIGGFTNKAMEDNTWEYYPVIIDTETGEKIKLGPFPSALFKCSQPFAITDYGQLFISDHENGGSVIFDLNGDYMLSSIPEGCTNRGNVMGVSGDGSKWVGYAISEKQEGERIGQYRPIIWEDGEARMLSMPEKNFKGEDFSVGAMARGISADGSVIYGTTWDNSDGAMIYWKDGKVKYVGEDLLCQRNSQPGRNLQDESLGQLDSRRLSGDNGQYGRLFDGRQFVPGLLQYGNGDDCRIGGVQRCQGRACDRRGHRIHCTAYGRRRSVRPQCGSCHRNGSRMGLQRIRSHHSVGYLHQKRFAGRSGGARYGYGTAGGYEGENLPVVHHSSGTITKNSFHNFYIRLFDRWLVRGFVRYPSEGGYRAGTGLLPASRRRGNFGPYRTLTVYLAYF